MEKLSILRNKKSTNLQSHLGIWTPCIVFSEVALNQWGCLTLYDALTLHRHGGVVVTRWPFNRYIYIYICLVTNTVTSMPFSTAYIALTIYKAWAPFLRSVGIDKLSMREYKDSQQVLMRGLALARNTWSGLYHWYGTSLTRYSAFTLRYSGTMLINMKSHSCSLNVLNV